MHVWNYVMVAINFAERKDISVYTFPYFFLMFRLTHHSAGSRRVCRIAGEGRCAGAWACSSRLMLGKRSVI